MEKKMISLEEQKMLLLEIMDEVDRFCRMNEINYFLLGGSLIGAVRHKGFIPWDDDIDIGMLREDYNKFVTKFPYHNNKRYKLLSLETDNKYSYPFGKVIDTKTQLNEAIDHSDDLGIYVDVFPIDNCLSDYKETCKFLKRVIKYRWIRNAKIIQIGRRTIIKNIVLILAKAITVTISRRQISEKISKIAQKFKDSNSKYVGQLSGNVYGIKEIWLRDWLKELIPVEFEGRFYFIPKEYHSVLTATFGNYMQLPPEEKRISHHDFEVFWKL